MSALSLLALRRRVSGGGSIVAIADYDLRQAGHRWQDTAGTIAAASAGDPIGRLDDLSGNGHHLLAPGDSYRPLLEVVSGQAGAAFNSSILSMVSPDQITLGAATYALVYSLTNSGLFGFATTGGSYLDFVYASEILATRDSAADSDLGGPTYDNGARHVLVYVVAPGTATPRTVYVDGALAGSDGTGIGSTPQPGRLHLGGIAPLSGMGVCSVRRWTVYDGALDAGTVTTLSATLASDHGL